MVSNNPEESSYRPRQDINWANTTVFNDDHICEDGTINLLDKYSRYKRQCERVWLHSHNRCYLLENKSVSVARRSQ
jgi:hypothetical protein